MKSSPNSFGKNLEIWVTFGNWEKNLKSEKNWKFLIRQKFGGKIENLEKIQKFGKNWKFGKKI